MMETYARQICLPEIGLEGQKRLNASSVLVIGVGGLGCAALPYLAAAGIKRIGMIDCDRVEKSNLARQTLFGHSDVGQWKVEAAQQRLSAMYPDTLFQKEVLQINSQNALNLLCDYDLILDGTDNLQTRLAINDTCCMIRKPWVYASVTIWEGQVSLFLPDNPDYRTLFPEGTHEPAMPTCSSGGVLGPFAGMVGMIQAMEAVKWLAGVEETLAGKILLINGKDYRFTLVSHATSKNLSYEIPYSLLVQWMAKEQVQLIDVRDTSSSFDKDRKIVVYCQTGQRSLARMRQLRQEGFDAYSLEGGIKSSVFYWD